MKSWRSWYTKILQKFKLLSHIWKDPVTFRLMMTIFNMIDISHHCGWGGGMIQEGGVIDRNESSGVFGGIPEGG